MTDGTNNEIPPVDRSKRCSSQGGPLPEGYDAIDPSTGQQREYVVLCPAERAKGFVRPVRRTYVHIGRVPEGETLQYPYTKAYPGGCGSRTTCSQSIAETYARDPKFYSGTFCCSCREHRPLNEFVWEGTTEMVGS